MGSCLCVSHVLFGLRLCVSHLCRTLSRDCLGGLLSLHIARFVWVPFLRLARLQVVVSRLFLWALVIAYRTFCLVPVLGCLQLVFWIGCEIRVMTMCLSFLVSGLMFEVAHRAGKPFWFQTLKSSTDLFVRFSPSKNSTRWWCIVWPPLACAGSKATL